MQKLICSVIGVCGIMMMKNVFNFSKIYARESETGYSRKEWSYYILNVLSILFMTCFSSNNNKQIVRLFSPLLKLIYMLLYLLKC